MSDVGYMYNTERIVLMFSYNGRDVRIEYPIVKVSSRIHQSASQGYRSKPQAQVVAAQEREERRAWRVLVLLLKSKLELVSAAASTFETEFMPYLLLPDGTTVGQHVRTDLRETDDSGGMVTTMRVIALPAVTGS